jgi:hypothetical protein
MLARAFACGSLVRLARARMLAGLRVHLCDWAEQMSGKETSFLTALLAGGCAGTSVDVALFPLDTIKTRLQVRV